MTISTISKRIVFLMSTKTTRNVMKRCPTWSRHTRRTWEARSGAIGESARRDRSCSFMLEESYVQMGLYMDACWRRLGRSTSSKVILQGLAHRPACTSRPARTPSAWLSHIYVRIHIAVRLVHVTSIFPSPATSRARPYTTQPAA